MEENIQFSSNVAYQTTIPLTTTRVYENIATGVPNIVTTNNTAYETVVCTQ